MNRSYIKANVAYCILTVLTIACALLCLKNLSLLAQSDALYAQAAMCGQAADHSSKLTKLEEILFDHSHACWTNRDDRDCSSGLVAAVLIPQIEAQRQEFDRDFKICTELRGLAQ